MENDSLFPFLIPMYQTPFNGVREFQKRVVAGLPLVFENDQNISFDGYIGTYILRIHRIYRGYIGGYFYINIDKIEFI